jgi:hypothetical protein
MVRRKPCESQQALAPVVFSTVPPGQNGHAHRTPDLIPGLISEGIAFMLVAFEKSLSTSNPQKRNAPP